jgi:Holliday junction resolvase RusA-like endonuclease
MKILELHLSGQVRGGKNNMKMTRTGRHYPDPKFVLWRADMFRQIAKQLPTIHTITEHGFFWYFEYTPEDNRRRDVPAVLDAVFHVLEKAFIVKDDCQIKNMEFHTLEASRENAGILIQVAQHKGEL